MGTFFIEILTSFMSEWADNCHNNISDLIISQPKLHEYLHIVSVCQHLVTN